MGDNRTVMSLLQSDVAPVYALVCLDADLVRADFDRLTHSVEFVLFLAQLLFKDVGRIGSAGGHGDGAERGVSERGKGKSCDGGSGDFERAAIQANFIEAKLTVPNQVWIDDSDGSLHRVSF